MVTFLLWFLNINVPSSIGFDHINRNPPVLIRTPKLTRFEPAQYWGGGPPGNSVVLNPPFCLTYLLASLGRGKVVLGRERISLGV